MKGRCFPLDVRKAVVAAIEGGMSCRQAAKQFGVGPATAMRWRQSVLKGKGLIAKPRGGDQTSHRIEAYSPAILAAVAEKGDITLAELQRLLAAGGIAASISSIWSLLKRHGVTRQKQGSRWTWARESRSRQH